MGCLVMLFGACSSEADHVSSGGAGEGGAPNVDTNGSVGGDEADAGAGTTATARGGSGDGGSEDSAPLVELPKGSREVSDIVNLVDSDAAAELDDFLRDGPSLLQRSVNLFLTYYEERYDFIFLFTDHKVPNGVAVGRFITISSEPRVGTGAVSRQLLPDFQTNGRLKGAMAVQLGDGPLSHEIGHYWAVFLDPSFGFGAGTTYDSTVHWGYAGVNGVLGGFDPRSLACQTPAGASPPNCKAAANKRYRYVTKAFGPGGNSLPYAPLELYLMGLASLDEVPSEIPVLNDADEVPGSFDADAGTEVIDAAGMSIVKMSDITARHGVVKPLSEAERHFTSAFVLVSSAPATSDAIAEVAQRAAAFGDRGTHPLTKSFASDTSKRATMDTVLGPRRAVADPPPEPRPRFVCDVLAQDCDDGLACYNGSVCALPGKVPEHESCNRGSDCKAGATCVFLGNPPIGQCLRYCDGDDADSPLNCFKICGSPIRLVDENGNVIATVCGPK